ncbi:pre-mRNA-splicing factor 38A, putative [Entamoeba dispar SAW760]|uniref:Pre-mRNA-splicing factor 38 n=1 Tax=Entamoeba dispar (strain ATCC PRA-260 / SAW760) TaxID=370354 RepID=B0EPX8_ENTDS|nr:pre-mRNA-splicing factor 38A, putative [Entamoeba dispar SAW760]EDR23447.1 pre-mRNA-splicing factor 38A, putative [Entamoeba dispar SAW760]|eukprot:EDR23447.1 pre-mRNA-splicing factor 38A, putative [Entamoeba dispar SAW760]
MSGPERRLETILRNKIYNCEYWKQQCFTLTSETILDEIIKLHDFGGTYGILKKPTKFIVLIMKLLMLRPDKSIIYEYIMNDEFKYVRAIGAFYLRLVGSSKECYQFIEPLYYDYRPLKYRVDGKHYEVVTIDQFAWNLLHLDYYCDITLPIITARPVIESHGILTPRISLIKQHYSKEDFDELMKTVDVQ